MAVYAVIVLLLIDRLDPTLSCHAVAGAAPGGSLVTLVRGCSSRALILIGLTGVSGGQFNCPSRRAQFYAPVLGAVRSRVIRGDRVGIAELLGLDVVSCRFSTCPSLHFLNV